MDERVTPTRVPSGRAGWLPWSRRSSSGRVGRQRWPIRVLAGLVLLAAVGLLWPFADWSWWPVVTGLGVLVLLYLLRLDRLLLGWAPHLAGLVVVVLMAARSDPWAWGFAAGLAVLGVGFARLPDWRVLAVGALVALVCGVGYGISHYRTATQQQAEHTAADLRYRESRAALPADAFLSAITSDIAYGQEVKACGLLGSPGGEQFAAAAGAPSCSDAVRRMHTQVTNVGRYASPRLPRGAVTKRTDGTATVDGCGVWPDRTAAPGPVLGRFELRRHEGSTYVITSYAPCVGR